MKWTQKRRPNSDTSLSRRFGQILVVTAGVRRRVAGGILEYPVTPGSAASASCDAVHRSGSMVLGAANPAVKPGIRASKLVSDRWRGILGHVGVVQPIALTLTRSPNYCD